VDWVGVDSHVTLDDEGAAIARNLIGAARTIAMDSDDARRRRLLTRFRAMTMDSRGGRIPSTGVHLCLQLDLESVEYCTSRRGGTVGECEHIIDHVAFAER
jgi:hypothetical protein